MNTQRIIHLVTVSIPGQLATVCCGRPYHSMSDDELVTTDPREATCKRPDTMRGAVAARVDKIVDRLNETEPLEEYVEAALRGAIRKVVTQ